MAIVGGLSILVGFHGKLGAWLLVLFLVPVTFAMHNFWTLKDPMMQQIQMAMFLKNFSMLGSALFFTQIGTGSLSSLPAAGRFANPELCGGVLHFSAFPLELWERPTCRRSVQIRLG